MLFSSVVRNEDPETKEEEAKSAERIKGKGIDKQQLCIDLLMDGCVQSSAISVQSSAFSIRIRNHTRQGVYDSSNCPELDR